MRSFIASMGGPRAPERAVLAGPKPVMESSKEAFKATAEAAAVRAEDQSWQIMPVAKKCPKRKRPASTSRVSASVVVKEHVATQGKHEAVEKTACSSAVIELSDTEEGVSSHSDDIIVQRTRRKGESVIECAADEDGRAVTLVTPAGATAVGGRRAAVAASSSNASKSRWTCSICTYCHRPEEWQYLQCALCASSRPALSMPSPLC